METQKENFLCPHWTFFVLAFAGRRPLPLQPTPLQMLLADAPDPVQIPRNWRTLWIQFFFWVFMLSFSFDFRSENGSGSSTLFQFLFLAVAASSTGGILLLGFPYLRIRPGAWVLWLWGLFLLFMFGNAFLQGVPPGRFLRTGLPFLLSFAAMLNGHMAACSGIRLAHLAAPIYVTVIINIVWRMIYGLAFTEATVETVRVQILSPALGWAAAFMGCSIMLRSRFHWTLLLAAACFFTALLLSITRSLLFPIAISGVATTAFFLLGMRWGAFHLQDLFKRLIPLTVAGGGALLLIISLFIAFPSSLDRWQERLFSPTNDRNIVADPSLMTRQAEAKAIFDILDREPVHYINGMGVGASFYWDDDYFPELYSIYDKDELEEMSSDIWYAGHSIWTYSMFAGGFIALTAFIGLFITVISFSIASAAANAKNPGPDYWLIFLPAVSALCILSESATSNPFDERLLGMIFGATFSFAQAGFLRASWLQQQTAEPVVPKRPIL